MITNYIAGIAVACLACVFHAQFERRKARLFADFIGDNLIERDAVLDFDQRLLHLNPGEIRTRAAPVIARAVEQRTTGIVRQIANLEHVVFERLEWLQGARKLLELAFVGGVPGIHDHAVRHVKERHAHGRFRGCGHSGRHRVQERQPDSGGPESQIGRAHV